jgi:hypothetical protein
MAYSFVPPPHATAARFAAVLVGVMDKNNVIAGGNFAHSVFRL